MDWKTIKQWLFAAGVRALKTFAQAMVAAIGIGAAFNEINWLHILSVAGVAAVLSLLTSVAGLPEIRLQTRVEALEATIAKNNAERHKKPPAQLDKEEDGDTDGPVK